MAAARVEERAKDAAMEQARRRAMEAALVWCLYEPCLFRPYCLEVPP